MHRHLDRTGSSTADSHSQHPEKPLDPLPECTTLTLTRGRLGFDTTDWLFPETDYSDNDVFECP